jgi:hypothetical protein
MIFASRFPQQLSIVTGLAWNCSVEDNDTLCVISPAPSVKSGNYVSICMAIKFVYVVRMLKGGRYEVDKDW